MDTKRCEFCGKLAGENESVEASGYVYHGACVSEKISALRRTIKYAEDMYLNGEISRQRYLDLVANYEKKIWELKGALGIKGKPPLPPFIYPTPRIQQIKNHCAYCDKKLESIPFWCRYCGRSYCSNCHSPEAHSCWAFGKTESRQVEETGGGEGWGGLSKSFATFLLIAGVSIGLFMFFAFTAPTNHNSTVIGNLTTLPLDTTPTNTPTTSSRPLQTTMPPTNTPATTSPQLNVLAIEQEIFNLVNKERQAGGIAPLRWNQKIADIARAYSKEQSTGGFAHKDVTGRGPGERIKDAGLFYIVAGENLALVDRDSLSAGLIVQLWMGSPGHRSAILDRDELFSDAGVGVYCTAQECYATIDFVGLKKHGEITLRRDYFTASYLYDPSYGFQFTSIPVYINVKSNTPINIYITSMGEYDRFSNRGSEGQLTYLLKATKTNSFERNHVAKSGEVLVFEAIYGNADIQYYFDYRRD